MTMQIDIVVTNFNRKETVKIAIESALRTQFQHVIVVDDASEDGSYEMLKMQYADNDRVKLFQTHANLGVSGAKNKGFELSNADWVIVLDSDDRLVLDGADEAVETLKNAKQFPIVFFRCIDHEGNFVGTRQNEILELDLPSYVRHTSYGEALIAHNKSLASQFPYLTELRGYEGLGCARIIEKYGPALLSDVIFRVYDCKGADRLSNQRFFSHRTKLLARGHVLFYKEFAYAMTVTQRIKMLLKIFAYKLISRIYGPFETKE